MLIPVFSLKLHHKLFPRMVAIGKYDGKHPCLSAATLANKVVIHNPHKALEKVGGRLASSNKINPVNLLSINQQISSLSCGCINEEESRDILFVGGPNFLLAYDVENNSDSFYKEIDDGANTLLVGSFGSSTTPLVYAGGNCSIQGFNAEGDEEFWTVTGDNVRSLAFVDFDKDGSNELLAGSEDYEIRVFKDDEIIAEMSETEVVTNLYAISGSKFGYALSNGCVGVYDGTARYWRIKSKHQATSIHSFDITGDGVPELITGWSNGKIDARKDANGEIVFKDSLSSSIAGVLDADYRMDGTNQLVVCSMEGLVKGYVARPPPKVFQPATSTTAATTAAGGGEELNTLLEKKRTLELRKQNLKMEIQVYEENSKIGDQIACGETVPAVSIPASTQVITHIRVVNNNGGCTAHNMLLTVNTNNETLIKCVMIFAEGVFDDGESLVLHPIELLNEIDIPLCISRDVPVDLHIQVLVCAKNSSKYHVFEITRQLPRFAIYIPCVSTTITSTSFVTFDIGDRINRLSRLVLWVNQNFLLPTEVAKENEELDFKVVSARTQVMLQLTMSVQGEMTIRCDDIDLAGNVIQSLTSFFAIEDLQSYAEFPDCIEQVKLSVGKCAELNAVRVGLHSEMADQSNLIRSLVVRAEDARLLSDMDSMMVAYRDLIGLNRDLIRGYNIRCTNHRELVEDLKLVNQVVQRSANLRVGKAKARVISECRKAINANDVNRLIKTITHGSCTT